ncbi:hypothetical protein chiPu_0028668 [Chiloscyllium punctatum]|uniref:Uncharacterized protein n=1 Tax=Chiloscyllium punctatum TaxID=137246 RepID=A0A401TP38_CHIPU|nr:hypothetical protein [Chiloscyllium punctatum]
MSDPQAQTGSCCVRPTEQTRRKVLAEKATGRALHPTPPSSEAAGGATAMQVTADVPAPYFGIILDQLIVDDVGVGVSAALKGGEREGKREKGCQEECGKWDLKPQPNTPHIPQS